jgi:hypothetical protein
MPDRALPEATTEIVKATAAFWSGIVPPNDAALAMAGQLAATRDGFAALRGAMAFEEEPAAFEAVLVTVKETGL